MAAGVKNRRAFWKGRQSKQKTKEYEILSQNFIDRLRFVVPGDNPRSADHRIGRGQVAAEKVARRKEIRDFREIPTEAGGFWRTVFLPSGEAMLKEGGNPRCTLLTTVIARMSILPKQRRLPFYRDFFSVNRGTQAPKTKTARREHGIPLDTLIENLYPHQKFP